MGDDFHTNQNTRARCTKHGDGYECEIEGLVDGEETETTRRVDSVQIHLDKDSEVPENGEILFGKGDRHACIIDDERLVCGNSDVIHEGMEIEDGVAESKDRQNSESPEVTTVETGNNRGGLLGRLIPFFG